jgi:hypothetical protein
VSSSDLSLRSTARSVNSDSQNAKWCLRSAIAAG